METVLIIGKGAMGTQVATLLKKSEFNFLHLGAKTYSKPNLISPRFIFEFGLEEFRAKADLLSKLSKDFPSSIIASGTSSFSISELSKYIDDASRFLGVHFMNPIAVIKEVEIIPQEKTDFEVLQECLFLLQKLNMRPIQVRDTPGFLLNTLLFSLINRAAYYLVETNESPEKIDYMMKNICKHKLGPLETADLIGIDVCFQILRNLYEQDQTKNLKPAGIFQELISQKKLGRKTKSGFYDYFSANDLTV